MGVGQRLESANANCYELAKPLSKKCGAEPIRCGCLFDEAARLVILRDIDDL